MPLISGRCSAAPIRPTLPETPEKGCRMKHSHFKRIRFNAPAVLGFVIASLAVLALDALTAGFSTTKLFCVYRSRLLDPLGYLRLFGHVLGHADLRHWIGNMTLILVLGPMLEEKYGSKHLLLSIAATALISGLVHCALSDGALLGASGIVFMMIMLSSLAGMESGTVPLTMIFVAVIYIGGEIVNGILLRDGVSQLTHIVGGICGTVIGFRLAKHHRRKGS